MSQTHHFDYNPKVHGSARWFNVQLGPVAQRIRRLTTDQEIAGSNPAGIVFLCQTFLWCQQLGVYFP